MADRSEAARKAAKASADLRKQQTRIAVEQAAADKASKDTAAVASENAERLKDKRYGP